MAQIEMHSPGKTSRSRSLQRSLRVDMTPLVDLGFLLITFFIFTTTIAESKVMKLNVPVDAAGSVAPESATISVLLGEDDRAYVYNGKWEEALANQQVKRTGYDVVKGIGSFIRAKQNWLEVNNKAGKKALIYLVKPAESSNFENVINALDEATINGVSRYALVPLSEEEKVFMKER